MCALAYTLVISHSHSLTHTRKQHSYFVYLCLSSVPHKDVMLDGVLTICAFSWLSDRLEGAPYKSLKNILSPIMVLNLKACLCVSAWEGTGCDVQMFRFGVSWISCPGRLWCVAEDRGGGWVDRPTLCQGEREALRVSVWGSTHQGTLTEADIPADQRVAPPPLLSGVGM